MLRTSEQVIRTLSSFTGAQLNFYPRFMSLAVFPQKITLKEARMDNPRFGPPFHKRKEPSW